MAPVRTRAPTIQIRALLVKVKSFGRLRTPHGFPRARTPASSLREDGRLASTITSGTSELLPLEGYASDATEASARTNDSKPNLDARPLYELFMDS